MLADRRVRGRGFRTLVVRGAVLRWKSQLINGAPHAKSAQAVGFCCLLILHASRGVRFRCEGRGVNGGGAGDDRKGHGGRGGMTREVEGIVGEDRRGEARLD